MNGLAPLRPRAPARASAGIRARAFTLLEALVAVGMVLLLAGALALFVADLHTTREHVMRTAERTRGAETLFAVVESALQTAVVDGARRGAGVSGTTEHLRVLSSRTDATAAGNAARDMTRMAFAPLSVTEVRQTAAGVVVGRSGVASLLPAEVSRVRLRYFDGRQWSDEFDSLASGSLPVMVEVAVWFGGAGAAEATDATDAPSSVLPEHAPDRVRRISVPDAVWPDEGAEPAAGTEAWR